jgi:hypothetical protein
LKKFLLALGFLGILLTACTGGSPNLILDMETIELGKVINGEIRTMEISLRNDGSTDLVIEGVSTSCGCTSAEISPSTISPGESALLTVSYDSGAHGPDENGPVMRQIFIASNDPDQAEIEFRFTADVISNDS